MAKTKKKKVDSGKVFLFGGLFVVVCLMFATFLLPNSYLKNQAFNSGKCECSAGHSLVCSDDNHTYTSVCEASCYGRSMVHLGEC